MRHKFIILILLVFLTAIINLYSQQEKIKLAILDLLPQHVPEPTALMVSDLLRTELFNTGLFRVIERSEMESVLKEQEFQISGCTETECAVQVGKLLSARKILIGTVGKLGKEYIINARIVDVESGEMEFADNTAVESESRLRQAVKEFAQKLSKKIIEKRSKPREEKPIEEEIEIKEEPKEEKKVEIKKEPEEEPEPTPEYEPKAEEPVSRQKGINLLWNIEFGGGDMVSTYFSIKIPQLERFEFGLGGAFTYLKEDNFGEKFSEYYYTFSGLISFRLIEFNSVWINLRERIGKQFIKIDKYNESGFNLSTDLLIGYKRFYGELALPIFFGNEGTTVLVKMGVGYQLKLF